MTEKKMKKIMKREARRKRARGIGAFAGTATAFAILGALYGSDMLYLMVMKSLHITFKSLYAVIRRSLQSPARIYAALCTAFKYVFIEYIKHHLPLSNNPLSCQSHQTSSVRGVCFPEDPPVQGRDMSPAWICLLT